MKKCTLFLIVALFSLCTQAQVALLQEPEENGSIENDIRTVAAGRSTDIFIPEAWDVNMDSLLNSWHIKHYVTNMNTEGYVNYEPVSDSVYVDRLSKLPCIIELPYNDVVRSCIDLYVDRRKNMVGYMLGLQAFYFPMIEQSLDTYGLPLELKYLAVVESALNPVALSRAGASGLWQFMLPTGKFYGLEINSLIDERRDPQKATDAACRYLKDLHGIYDDWSLAIAAYNCGPGTVNKAIKRAGGQKDYWTIYPYLPKETRTYVPLFIAANYAMNYHQYHHICPVETELPLSTDTVMVSDEIHFEQIADVLKIEKEDIRALNPQYKQDIVPGNSGPRPLKLPSIHSYAFVELQDSIKKHRAEELFTNRTYIGKMSGNKEKKIHRVKKGETIASIGNRYGVTSAEIRKWNGLKSNRVAAGRNLTIYVDNGGYVSRETSRSKTTTSSSSKTTPSSRQTTTAKTATKTDGTYVSYKVKSGESFYTIAKKYPGYSHTDLMRINNTKSPSLKVGQVIKVPRG